MGFSEKDLDALDQWVRKPPEYEIPTPSLFGGPWRLTAISLGLFLAGVTYTVLGSSNWMLAAFFFVLSVPYLAWRLATVVWWFRHRTHLPGYTDTLRAYGYQMWLNLIPPLGRALGYQQRRPFM
jgi:hypothetical protein